MTDEQGEVRELMAADFDHFRPAADMLPQSLAAKLLAQRKKQQTQPTTDRILVTLSRDVADRFRATGDERQMRLEAALRERLEHHSAT